MTALVSRLVSDVFDVLYDFLSIEQGRSLLERLALCLDEEEEDVDELEEEPAAVDNVELPAKGLECNRVHKLVRRDANSDRQVLQRGEHTLHSKKGAETDHHGESTSTNGVRENLDRIGDEHGSIG